QASVNPRSNSAPFKISQRTEPAIAFLLDRIHRIGGLSQGHNPHSRTENFILRGIVSICRFALVHFWFPPFPDYFTWFFVVAEVAEFGVAKEVTGGPFGKFDLGDDLRVEPNIVFHFVGGDAFAPVAAVSARQVREGTLFCGEWL